MLELYLFNPPQSSFKRSEFFAYSQKTQAQLPIDTFFTAPAPYRFYMPPIAN